MKPNLVHMTTLFYLCVSCYSLDTTSDTAEAMEDYAPQCFNIAVRPMHRAVYDYNGSGDPYQGVPHISDIHYHIFDSRGNQISTSSAGTSRICYNDGSDECHYLFLEGHGFYIMVDDNNIILSQGDLVFARPKLIRMGHCPQHCHGEEQQLVLVGENSENPTLYDSSKNPSAVREVLFDRVDQNASDHAVDVGSDEAATAAAAAVEDNSLSMKTMCINPAGCYKLVGSAVYVLSRNDSVIEEEGTTYDGYNTIGATDKCHQRCDEKPLLVSTRRGQEITLTLSSISGMESITDVNSPQYSAACWLIHDDSRQLKASDNSIIQRYILALLFYTLRGSEWTNNYDFLTPKDECEWTKWSFFNGLRYFFSDGNGVLCNESGEVSKIILAENNLVGTLPAEISWLTQVEFLEFSSNTIQGSIPYQFGHLKNLRNFRLRGNGLTGTLPQSFGQMESLVVVDVGNNMLEGSMISIPRPCNLYAIDFRHNLISGTIPNDIGTCTSLGVLNVNSNLLTGTIPEIMGDLDNLGRVSLQSNNLIGSIPSGILSLTRLTTFWASENALSGEIPKNVRNDTALAALLLDHNHLTGTIPPELSLAKGMRHLYLQSNDLTGEMPSDLAKLETLSVLRFQNNDIIGNIPFEACEQFVHLEADCGSPEKVSCACCSDCHGIFRDYNDESVCPSRELKIIFEGLGAGYDVNFMLQNSDGEIQDNYDFAAEGTSHTYTTCISTSSCFELHFGTWTTLPFEMTMLVDEDIVAEEFVTELGSTYRFGYSSSQGGGTAKDRCDSFELCNTAVEPNSTKRELINKLTRITGIDVFEDSASPHHQAACEWMSFLNRKSDEDSMQSTLLQHYILALIYFVTNGKEWKNSDLWLTDESFCSWYGISCDNYGIITAVDLSSNNLVGLLPTEIAGLRGLEELSLSNNEISGAIPSDIGKLTQLRKLRASQNLLRGDLPSEIGRLSSLQEVDLSNNQLADAIPIVMGQLENMEVLDLYNNTFSGEIPDSFYALTGLKHLCLGSNLFAGDAKRMGRFLNLELLDLSDNFFTGSIPLNGYLNKLQVLRLSGNRFRGSIPMSVGQLQLLEELFVHSNRLTGNLPSELGNLERLAEVSLSYNSIKGSIPSEIGNLRNLTRLHLHSNFIEGQGDHFDYSIGDYITDCGSTYTALARVECIGCSLCCNVDGNCLRKSLTWPRPENIIETSQIEPRAFVFLMTLCASLALVVLLFILALFCGVKQFSTAEFQEESAYKFLLSENYWANGLAILSVILQLFLLSIFIEASDFTSVRNDWEYSTSCPDNSLYCEDRRRISDLAWLAFSCILAAYLLKDVLEGCKMIYESMILRSIRGILAGFVVIFVTLASIEASTLYNYSTGISSTDILKDAVILLFLNDIDEQLYAVVRTMRPKWVEKRNEHVQNWLDRRIRRIRRLRPGSGIVTLKLDLTEIHVDTKESEPMQKEDIETSFGETYVQQLEKELNNLDSNQIHMRTIYEKEISDMKVKNTELENKYNLLENRNDLLEKEMGDLKKIIMDLLERETREGEDPFSGENTSE